jgi:hypothetical protein
MQSLTARVAAASAAPASAGAPSQEFALRARVLCSYEPRQEGELALTVDDVVYVKKDAGLPSGWYLGQADGKEGRVHDDYLEFIDD